MKLIFLIIYVFILFFSFRFGQSSGKNQFFTGRSTGMEKLFTTQLRIFTRFECVLSTSSSTGGPSALMSAYPKGELSGQFFCDGPIFLNPPGKFFFGFPWKYFLVGPSFFFCGSFFLVSPNGWRKKSRALYPFGDFFL
jgi:hypothetical protein